MTQQRHHHHRHHPYQERLREKSPSPTNLTSIASDLKDAMLYTCHISNNIEDNNTSSSSSSLHHYDLDTTGIVARRDASPSTSSSRKRIGDGIKAVNDAIEIDDLNTLHISMSYTAECSFTSCEDDDDDSSDSDISLCRSFSQKHHQQQHQQQQQHHHHQQQQHSSPTNNSMKAGGTTHATTSSDGDCVVSSFANLFLGQGNPCSLQSEGEEGSIEIIDQLQQHHRGQYTTTQKNLHQRHTSSTISPNQRLNAKLQPKHSILKKTTTKQDEDEIPATTTLTTASSTGSNSLTTTGSGCSLLSLDNSPSITTKQQPTDPPTLEDALLAESLSTDVVPLQPPAVPKQEQHRVTFDQVMVREYSLSLSYNPAVSEGPPIELGWDVVETTLTAVDDFESNRKTRRRLHELLVSERERRRRLLEAYTPEQVIDSIRQVEQLKRQRILTVLLLPASALDEAAEDALHYLTRVWKGEASE